MTGPQGAGVFASVIMIPEDVGGIGGGGVSPIEFVYAYSSFTRNTIQFPHSMHWLPGDYVFVAWWDYNNPTLTAIPNWLTRLDNQTSSVNPAILGGFIPDVGGMIQQGQGVNWGFALNTSLADQSRCIMDIAVYRNVSNRKVLESYVLDRLNLVPLDDTVDAVIVPDDGSSILLGLASTVVTTSFIMQSPAVERLSEELATNRATRVFDQLNGAGSKSYQTTNTDGFPPSGNDNNYFWNMAVNAGPDQYDEPYPAIGLVGTSNGTQLSGSTITVTLPGSRIEGDLLMVALHLDSNQGIQFNDLTGWRQVKFGAGTRQINVFLKRDNGSESNPTFTATVSGATKHYCCAVYRGVGAVNWLQGANATTLTPTPTTTIDNTRAVAIAVSEFYQPVTIATANGYTQRATQNDVNDGGITLADKVFSGALTTMDFPVFTAPNTGFFVTALLTMVPGVGVPVTTPFVTIEQGENQNDPTSNASVVFDVEFSEPVYGLTAADFTLGGTVSGTLVGTLQSLGTGAHYTLTVTGMTSNGTVTASLAGSTVASVNFDINNASSTSDDNTVTFDPWSAPVSLGGNSTSSGAGDAASTTIALSGLSIPDGALVLVMASCGTNSTGTFTATLSGMNVPLSEYAQYNNTGPNPDRRTALLAGIAGPTTGNTITVTFPASTAERMIWACYIPAPAVEPFTTVAAAIDTSTFNNDTPFNATLGNVPTSSMLGFGWIFGATTISGTSGTQVLDYQAGGANRYSLAIVKWTGGIVNPTMTAAAGTGGQAVFIKLRGAFE